ANTSSPITSFDTDDGQTINNLIFRAKSNELIFIHGDSPNRRGEIPNPALFVNAQRREIMKVDLASGEIERIGQGNSPQLSPDENTLAFTRGGQVYFYNFQEKTTKKAFHIRGSAAGIRWSPNGNHLAFESRRGDHGFVGVFDLQNNSLEYLSPSVDQDQNIVWSPDGSQLAFKREPNERGRLPFFERRTAHPWSIWVHTLSTGKTEQIWIADKGYGSAYRSISAANQLFWTADQHIVFPYEGNGYTQLFAVSVSGGEAQCLTPGAFEVQFVSISPDKKSIFYSSNHGDIDRQHIWTVSPKIKAKKLTTAFGIQWSPVITAKGDLVCLASTATFPAHVAQFKNNQLEQLAKDAFPSNFPENDLVTPEQVIFSAADGLKIHGQLFKPKNFDSNQKYPAILFFHGGSRRQMLLGFHHRGYYHNAYAMNQYLASQGYIVMSVNYRSGIGYGLEFREALNYGAEGASEFNDVMGAGLYMRNHPNVDPDKIGLWGGSYGGYLTAMGLAKSSDLFAAGVDIHGVHDWNIVIKNFVSSYDPNKRKALADLAYQSSPMPYVKDWRSPVLLIHGDDDRNVPFSETVDIVESLRDHDVYFEQLIFPDEVHGFLLHQNWINAYKASADFFNRMLKK
ncbi:MAG: prolyl oligopeptidase family serine peptidase, partial [Bacteroidota bacterium]